MCLRSNSSQLPFDKSLSCLELKNQSTDSTFEYQPKTPQRDHGFIAVSAFNSYFSVKNMEILFNWSCNNFRDFNVFIMDEVSIFNLMALGYNEGHAYKKTRKHDNNLKNKVIKSLVNIGFSLEMSNKKILFLSNISQSETYINSYERYLKIFENNLSFRNDCLGATKSMLLDKVAYVSNNAVNLSVKYLLAELPFWFDIPYVLNIPSSTLVYKDMPFFWKRICYNYGLLSPQQEILIKNVDR